MPPSVLPSRGFVWWITHRNTRFPPATTASARPLTSQSLRSSTVTAHPVITRWIRGSHSNYFAEVYRLWCDVVFKPSESPSRMAPMTLHAPSGDEVTSPAGLEGVSGTLLPGLVDIQVNGGFGHDFTTDPSSIWEVGALLPQFGVTAFLPTVISGPVEVATAALEVLSAGPPADWQGARPLGLHVEGPMISPAKRGTHPSKELIAPSPEYFYALLRSSPPAMVTIAPELEGAEDAVKRLAAAGSTIALGHSDATVEQAGAAVGWGATHVTHVLNAMSGLHHRTPGLAAIALTDDELTVGLIADGIHIEPTMLRLVLRAKGPERIALVTDAMSAMGMPGGNHTIGSTSVLVEGITVRNAEGNLAGSAATLDAVLRTMVETTGCSLSDVAVMTSTTPYHILGMALPPTDQVVLGKDLTVKATVVDGEILYRSGA
ncbi:MAG: amidohydrolase family protein [Acidimicrobiia bacterium]|nr:amidohydrolase family protein [Acidimicrobiia bacterium]